MGQLVGLNTPSGIRHSDGKRAGRSFCLTRRRSSPSLIDTRHSRRAPRRLTTCLALVHSGSRGHTRQAVPSAYTGAMERFCEEYLSPDGSTSIRFSSRPGPVQPPPAPGPCPAWLVPAVEAVLGDMQQPTSVPLTVGYRLLDEPDNFGIVSFTEPDGHMFGFGVSTDAPTTELLLALADGLQQNFPELSAAWGQARPACPGDTHPMEPRQHRGQAWWVCPGDSRPVTPIGSVADSDG
jgi:hypothetical protein